MAIERVRRNFIIIIMSILAAVIIIGSIGIVSSNFAENARQADTVLNKVADAYLMHFENGGAQSPNLNELAKLDIARTFCIRLDEQGDPIDLGTFDTEVFSSELVAELTEKILQGQKTKGNFDGYYYLIKTSSAHITVLTVTDRNLENEFSFRMLYVVSIATVSALGILYLIVWRLSYYFMKPIEATFSQQKQFVSDAGHELKTPIATISANAEVLSSEVGDNKWLNAIKSQTHRMSTLIEEMLTLARMEEEVLPGFKISTFDLSSAVNQCALPYEGTLYEQRKTLHLFIEEGIFLRSDANAVKKIVGILMDNAAKYSDKGGEVHLTLKSKKSEISLSVFNTGSFISPKEQKKIFTRFYRSDTSRDRKTGGHGLGLAIAKTLIDGLDAQIEVKSDERVGTTFTVTFPKN